LALIKLIVDDGKPLPSRSPTTAKTNEKKNQNWALRVKIVLPNFFLCGMIFSKNRYFLPLIFHLGVCIAKNNHVTIDIYNDASLSSFAIFTRTGIVA
jgi:hypothetical protein